MILSNLAKAIREQNYYAVFLELLIVVFGVVIGFQVTAWNADRADRQSEALILERLESDFTQIIDSLEGRIRFVEGMIEASDVVLNEAASGALLEDLPSVADKLDRIGFTTPGGSSPTYRQLISNGDMELVRSEELRRALIEYDVLLDRHRSVNGALLNARASARRVSPRAFAPTGEFDLPPAYEQRFEEMLASPDFFAHVYEIRGLIELDMWWHREDLERAQAVLAQINAIQDEAEASQ